MSDEVVLSEGDLPFRKRRRATDVREPDTLKRRAVKAAVGAALTGDPSGAVVGAISDVVIDRVWRKKR